MRRFIKISSYVLIVEKESENIFDKLNSVSLKKAMPGKQPYMMWSVGSAIQIFIFIFKGFIYSFWRKYG